MSDPTGTAPGSTSARLCTRRQPSPGAAHAPDTSHAHFRTLPVDVEGFEAPRRAGARSALVMEPRRATSCGGSSIRLCGSSRTIPGRCCRRSRGRDRAVVGRPSVSRKRVDELLTGKRQSRAGPGWFQQAHPQSPLSCVAYFSMEFMLSEALPIYSGGLGNVAGDQLKAASDLGVPVVGVGLLYQQGIFAR